VKIWLARTLIAVLVFAAMPPERAAANTPLAPLPPTVRVNISLLGTTYAKIGSTVERTFTVSVEDPDRTIHTLHVLGWQYRLPVRFVFTGRGYGHGVGMSQWGAQGMALGGKSAEEILRHYYQGIEITSLGGA
jgi:peptidoglycan hydrolase-like amidase